MVTIYELLQAKLRKNHGYFC